MSQSQLSLTALVIWNILDHLFAPLNIVKKISTIQGKQYFPLKNLCKSIKINRRSEYTQQFAKYMLTAGYIMRIENLILA